MEQWEIKLREKLEKELPEGSYDIGTDNFVCITGKGGYINFRVALAKEVQKMNSKVEIQPIYSAISKDKLTLILNKLIPDNNDSTKESNKN